LFTEDKEWMYEILSWALGGVNASSELEGNIEREVEEIFRLLSVHLLSLWLITSEVARRFYMTALDRSSPLGNCG